MNIVKYIIKVSREHLPTHCHHYRLYAVDKLYLDTMHTGMKQKGESKFLADFDYDNRDLAYSIVELLNNNLKQS